MRRYLSRQPAQATRPARQERPGAGSLRSLISQMGNQAALDEVGDMLAQDPPPACGGGQPLEKAMQARMERQFGLSLADVRVHRDSEEPVKYGARAYTQGTEIFLGPGQEKCLPHELGHVAQQLSGTVVPTGAAWDGTPVNTDSMLEQQASMGESVGNVPRQTDSDDLGQSAPLQFMLFTEIPKDEEGFFQIDGDTDLTMLWAMACEHQFQKNQERPEGSSGGPFDYIKSFSDLDKDSKIEVASGDTVRFFAHGSSPGEKDDTKLQITPLKSQSDTSAGGIKKLIQRRTDVSEDQIQGEYCFKKKNCITLAPSEATYRIPETEFNSVREKLYEENMKSAVTGEAAEVNWGEVISDLGRFTPLKFIQPFFNEFEGLSKEHKDEKNWENYEKAKGAMEAYHCAVDDFKKDKGKDVTSVNEALSSFLEELYQYINPLYTAYAEKVYEEVGKTCGQEAKKEDPFWKK